MNYRMIVTISDPNTEEGKSSAIVLNLKAAFAYDPDTYGNGHTMAVFSEDRSFFNAYDIRYDRSFRRNKKKEYLKEWAHSYWNGKDGAYQIDSLEIAEEK